MFQSPVKHIVLQHEEHIEEHGKQTQSEFGGITENGHPIIWKPDTISFENHKLIDYILP